MASTEPVAQVEGLIPAGSSRPGRVLLREGETWSVGRADPGYLASHPEDARWHLGVPDARPDLSVNALELRVGRFAVHATSQRDAGVTVDGVLRTGPALLGAGRAYVNPSTSALHVDFVVTVLRSDPATADAQPRPASGTTLMLQISLEAGSAAWKVAHALAWPCMPCERRPLSAGWSGRDVANRLDQLGWSVVDPDRGRAAGGSSVVITQIGRQLLVLADKVENGKLTDNRRADLVFPMWPPWLEDAPLDETRDEKAERRNRFIAEALWRAQAVRVETIDGRPRR